jgi:hypothetical protein
MSARRAPFVPTHGHVCLIHYGETSRRPVLLQWTRDALAAGEGVLLVEPREAVESFRELLGEPDARVVYLTPEEAHRREGNEPKVVRHLTAPAPSADGSEVPIRRLSSPVSHALSVLGDADAHVEYEERLGELTDSRGDLAVLCQYDRVLVDGALVERGAAAHSVVVQLDDLALPTLDLRPTGDGVKVSGEIDAANASIVRAWMSRHGRGSLVVDCSNLTFIDVAGYRALTDFASEGSGIELTHLSGVPKRLVSLVPEILSGHVSVRSGEE